MSDQILTEYHEIRSYVDEVRELADSNRHSLGFLPSSAYEELAARERLWVVVADQSRELVGYLLFGGRYPHIKIFQLFVSERGRGRGFGRNLVGQLKDFAAQCKTSGSDPMKNVNKTRR